MSNSKEQEEFLIFWDNILEQEEELARNDPDRQTPLTPELARQFARQLGSDKGLREMTVQQLKTHPRVLNALFRIIDEFELWRMRQSMH